MDYSYEVARAIHKERLRRAAARRTREQVEEVRAGIQATMLARLGELLIAAGLKLKQPAQSQRPGLKLT
jgi:hypothetical protein